MRVLMGIIKHKNGTYYVRRKVPQKLEAEVARLMSAGKLRVSWLKESLKTKDARRANLLAKPVMMKFDRLLAQAESALKPRPLSATLSDHEVKRIADYYFATLMAEDEEHRQGDLDDTAEFGLSDRRFRKHTDNIVYTLAGSEAALAQGNIAILRFEIDEQLDVHGLQLDRSSEA